MIVHPELGAWCIRHVVSAWGDRAHRIRFSLHQRGHWMLGECQALFEEVSLNFLVWSGRYWWLYDTVWLKGLEYKLCATVRPRLRQGRLHMPPSWQQILEYTCHLHSSNPGGDQSQPRKWWMECHKDPYCCSICTYVRYTTSDTVQTACLCRWHGLVLFTSNKRKHWGYSIRCHNIATYLHHLHLKIDKAKTTASFFYLHNAMGDVKLNVKLPNTEIHQQTILPGWDTWLELGLYIIWSRSLRKSTLLVNLIRRLAGTSWGAVFRTLCTTAACVWASRIL